MEDNFFEIIEQIAFERGLPKEKVENAVKEAIGAAFRKDYGNLEQKIRVEIDYDKKIFKVFVTKKIVNLPTNEFEEIPLILAHAINLNAKLGENIEVEETPEAGYGRIASQNARQVIVQKLHEAERELVALAYQSKIGEILSGVVYEIDKKGVILTLEQGQAILPYEGQIRGEKYYTGQRLRFLIDRIDLGASGPGEQVVVTRSSEDFVRKLFEIEVPELSEKSVEIVKVAREPGRRTKVAVKSLQEGIDAVGTFVGQRGVRVRAVSDELGEEKLDLVLWSENLEEYVRNALSPAKIAKIVVNEDKTSAGVLVPENQLALTIGRGGQNIRLASKLAGIELNVKVVDEDGNLIGEEVAKVEEEKSQPIEKVVIIHGNGGGSPNDHWYKSVQFTLENLGLTVVNEQFPENEIAPKNVWLDFLKNSIGVDENTIIIGHSSGGVAAMRLAEIEKLKGLILVGVNYTDLGDELEKQSGYYDEPWLWEKIKENTDWIIQYASKDDQFIPLEEAETVSQNLNSDFRVFEDKGHFMADNGVTDFPEIVEDIKTKLSIS